MIVSAIDRLRELGGDLYLSAGRPRYRIPADSPEAQWLIAELRQDREAVIEMLRDRESKPPSLEEVAAMLPPRIRILRYEPKSVPFAVAPASVVTNAGKFYQAYLRDLRWREGHPDGYAVPPLTDILAKLADAGLDLISDGDLPV